MGRSFSPPLNKDITGCDEAKLGVKLKKHPHEHYEWNLDPPTMNESAAKRFYISIFVCAATERKKHKDFWVMKSCAWHFKLTLRSCWSRTTKQDHLKSVHGHRLAQRNSHCTSHMSQMWGKGRMQSRHDRSNQQPLTMKLSKMPRRSGKTPRIPSLHSFHCRPSRVLSCLRSWLSIKHVQPNSLCLSVSKTSHTVHSRGEKNASFPSCIQSMGKMGNGECERVTTPGVDIIPQLLLGIWYINTALEKH